MRDKNTEAMVSVVLELTKDSDNIVGAPVTEEELAAYIENGLDPVRRAQVSSYIANDQSVYTRWMRLVENAEDFISDTDVAAVQQPTSTMLSGFLEAFNRFSTRWLLIPSGAVGAVAVAVMAFYLLQPVNQLDGLYSDFGPSSINSSLALPTRSFNPLEQALPPTNEGIVLDEGVGQGLVTLNVYQNNYVNGHKNELIKAKGALGKANWPIYLSLGRWAVLSHYHCLQKTPTYVERAGPVLMDFINQLSKIDTEYARALEKELQSNINKDNSLSESICSNAFILLEKAANESIKY